VIAFPHPTHSPGCRQLPRPGRTPAPNFPASPADLDVVRICSALPHVNADGRPFSEDTFGHLLARAFARK
jgi:hypothetical protein